MLVIIRSKDFDLRRETPGIGSIGIEAGLRRGPKGNTSSWLLSVDSSGTVAGALGLVSRARDSALPSMRSNHSLTLSTPLRWAWLVLERVCCLLVLNTVTSTSQWIRLGFSGRLPWLGGISTSLAVTGRDFNLLCLDSEGFQPFRGKD